MFSPEVIRPSKRIYVGGLPPDTMDVRAHSFESLSRALTARADHTG